MAKYHSKKEPKSDKKRQPKVKSTVVEEVTDDLADLAQLSSGPVADVGDGVIEAQAARLNDPRLQTAQRQAMAARIGRVQGNQHLQRVVASLEGGEKMAKPTFAHHPVSGNWALQRNAQDTAELDETITGFSHEQDHEQPLDSVIRPQMKALAACGTDFPYTYAGEKELGVVQAQMKALAAYGMDFPYGGKKELKGAQAQWETTSTVVKAHTEKKGGKWFVVLDKFEIKFKYWLNSKARWDHIKDFPGGSTPRDDFNTPEGSKVHEKAEMKAVETLWKNAGENIRKAIAKGFKSKKAANQYYQKVSAEEYADYKKKQKAISEHKNSVGPDAEWAYHQKEYAKYKASLKKTPKKAPKKAPKKTP